MAIESVRINHGKCYECLAGACISCVSRMLDLEMAQVSGRTMLSAVMIFM